MKQILFATTNKSKINDFKEKLFKYNIEVLSLEDLNIKIDVNENGKSAIENALLKVRACKKHTNLPIIGMDDSLYLEGVPENIQPGLYVRRVSGKTLNDEEMIDYYTSIVKKYGINGRIDCKWVYGFALIDADRKEYTYSWYIDNYYMVKKPSNIIKPGYPLNSITKYKENNKYFDEINDDEKEKLNIDNSDVISFIVDHIK